MKIRTNDGVVFEGQTALDIVDQMRLDTRVEPDENNEVYMEQVARRVKVWNGQAVDTTSPEEFLQSLARAGMIEIDQG